MGIRRFPDPLATKGDILYRDTSQKANVSIGSTDQVLTVSGGIPTWAGPYVPKPGFKVANTDTIVVEASGTTNVKFLIDSEVYTISSDLSVNTAVSGVGGLDTGSIVADTPYYLYGIVNSGSGALILSASDPDTGPTGHSSWTYLGAVATDSFSKNFTPAQSVNGIYIANEEIEIQDVNAGGSRTAKTFDCMPTTAKTAYFQLSADSGAGASASDAVQISGSDSGEDALVAWSLGANADSTDFGWVPIITAQTVYLTPDTNVRVIAQLQGWMEDIYKWK